MCRFGTATWVRRGTESTAGSIPAGRFPASYNPAGHFLASYLLAGCFLAGCLLAGCLLAGCSPDPLSDIPEPGPIEQPWLAGTGEGGPWNLLLITLDTTRQDRLGVYGYHLPITPFLDEVSARGALFENAVVSVPITLPSHATILTGLNPTEHGVRTNGVFVLDSTLVTLAEALKSQGYATSAVVGAMPLEKEFGIAQGFDHYDDDFPPQVRGEDAVVERLAEDVTDLSIEYLREHAQKPFFHWAHYYDPHYPYTPPDPYGQRFGFPYDGEIAYMDTHVRRLYEFFEREGLLENTWVLIVADHGEALGDHGEPAHGMLIYRVSQDAPLLLLPPRGWNALAPEQIRGRRLPDLVSARDLAPTMLNAVGLRQDLLPASGSSLLPLLAGDWDGPKVAYMESLTPALEYGWSDLRGIRTERWTYIRAPESELYDLEKDPNEQVNVYHEHPEIAGRLEAWCELFTGEDTEATAEAQDIDPGTLDRLRSLGYLSGSAPRAEQDTNKDPKYLMHLVRKINRARNVIMNQPVQAIELLQSVLAEEPENTVALRFLAQAGINAKRYEEAYGAGRKVLAKLPHDRDALLYVAQAAMMTDRVDESKELIDLALEDDPGDTRVLSVKAQLLMQLDREEDARELLREMLEEDPDDVTPLLRMARFEWAAARMELVEELVDQILASTPDVPSALAMRGELTWMKAQDLRESGQTDQARALLPRVEADMTRALEIDPAEPVACFRLGVIREIEGNLPAALQLYEQSLGRAPDNAEAYAKIGAVHRGMNQPAEALRYLERAEQMGLRSVGLYVDKGVANAMLGRNAEAREAWETALQLDPTPEMAEGIRRNLQILSQ